MKIFKFGGASVKDAEGIKNVANFFKDKRQLVSRVAIVMFHVL